MKCDIWDRFASKLETARDAPEPLGSAMLAALKPDDEVRLLIFGPAYKALRKTMPSTLLAVLAHEWILVNALEEHPAQVYRCNFADTLLVEITNILLHGILRIDFVIEGRAETVAITFNTVMEGLYQEAVQFLLNGMDNILEITPCNSNEISSVLKSLPMKFYNAIVEFIPMGQHVLGFVHWRAVMARKLRVFRQELSPEAVLVLTDRELLFISEEKASSWVGAKGVQKYGYIATHCPLSRVASFQFGEHDSLDTIDIVVRSLRGSEKLKIDFPREQKVEIGSFMERALKQQKAQNISSINDEELKIGYEPS